jgi:hypothetical protein
MKAIRIGLIIISFFLGKSALASNSFAGHNTHSIAAGSDQDTLVQYLSTLNLLQFPGLPVDSFLARIPSNYDSVKILTGDQLKKASKLYLKYSNGVIVAIYVRQFQYMNPNPPRSNWSISLFRKEDIDHIEIYQGVTCINGCNN